MRVGATHLGIQKASEHRATAQTLEAVASDPGLTLRWPEMTPDLPGEDRDRGDQWALDNQLASRTSILMRREQLTRDEAEARLQEIADDLQREQILFPAPVDPLQAAADAASQQGLTDDPETTISQSEAA